jgi:hypothetical protein
VSLRAESPARTAGTAGTAALARVRRASMIALVLVVAEYLIGMYVNLYSAVPAADHGQDVGTAITNGPAMLSIHAVLGLGAPGDGSAAPLARPARGG